jgi:hypothetical protein
MKPEKLQEYKKLMSSMATGLGGREPSDARQAECAWALEVSQCIGRRVNVSAGQCSPSR